MFIWFGRQIFFTKNHIGIWFFHHLWFSSDSSRISPICLYIHIHISISISIYNISMLFKCLGFKFMKHITQNTINMKLIALLIIVTASLLVVPLILPPLPPPPMMLMFFPVGIMAALMLMVIPPSTHSHPLNNRIRF